MHAPKRTDLPQIAGQTSISYLLSSVFLVGLLLTSLLVYSAFVNYRVGAVRDMAQADAKRISHLVFEHLYSVMRKGSNRSEIDDLVHHIQQQLPDYKVQIVRGEPVVRQYGDRPDQADLRTNDLELAGALANGHDYSGILEGNLRYLFPVKVSGECTGCHSMAKLGDVNGVISVSVPLLAIEAPIAAVAYPIMFLAFGLLLVVMLLTFLVLRQRVSKPIIDLTGHVSDITQEADYSRDLAIDPRWPQEVGILASHFNELMAQVRSSHDQLQEFSLHDPLTNLYNRRHFDAVIERASFEAHQHRQPFAVLLLDLDYFKPVNDQYGHAAGDAVLVGVAKAIQSALRDTDLAARIGGDEFAVLALATDADVAVDLVERLRTAIAACQFRFGHDSVKAACSIGLACYPDNGVLAYDLMHAADRAMYEDKEKRRAGR